MTRSILWVRSHLSDLAGGVVIAVFAVAAFMA